MSSDSSNPTSSAEPHAGSAIVEALGSAGLPILPAFAIHFCSALTLLEQGRRFASDTGAERIEFGIDQDQLRRSGVPDILLKWMVARGMASAETIPRADTRPAKPGDVPAQPVYVLTEHGAQVAEVVLCAQTNGTDQPNAPLVEMGAQSSAETEEIKPAWDDVRKELWYAGRLIKRYKLPSANQETVLTAFQEENWPLRIDDPLPPDAHQSSQARLGNTIKALNRNQKNALIRFRGDGTGEGVLWEPARRSE